MPKKKCTKCKKSFDQSPDCFYRNAAVKDGLQSCCKSCSRIATLKAEKKTHKLHTLNQKGPYYAGPIRQPKAVSKVEHISIEQYLWEKSKK